MVMEAEIADAAVVTDTLVVFVGSEAMVVIVILVDMLDMEVVTVQ
jgi:hypothetical protein